MRREPTDNTLARHVFIIGSKSIGQYGGYETFVDRLINEHENETSIQYHIACKANGDGYMDETKLSGVEILKQGQDGTVSEFRYKNAHVFKIYCPSIGPAVAIFYDWAAVLFGIKYCRKHEIQGPVFYILTCRIGICINRLKKKIRSIDGVFYLNPDGHEWKRAKWSLPVKKYWKWSEKTMVKSADLVICDSKNIEKYIIDSYQCSKTEYIAYGADLKESILSDEDAKFVSWLTNSGVERNGYYLIVGRFVPENNYEVMIREFMKSKSTKSLVLITNQNHKLFGSLEKKLGFSGDARIKFVGSVYDKELLKKIRENAYAYLHGHEVGGTNPSLLEALGSTRLNLLYDVGFNKEVAEDGALYWSKENGDLAGLINRVDEMSEKKRNEFGAKAKNCVLQRYSWKSIAHSYKNVFLQQ